jgi:hypothetical protein
VKACFLLDKIVFLVYDQKLLIGRKLLSQTREGAVFYFKLAAYCSLGLISLSVLIPVIKWVVLDYRKKRDLHNTIKNLCDGSLETCFYKIVADDEVWDNENEVLRRRIKAEKSDGREIIIFGDMMEFVDLSTENSNKLIRGIWKACGNFDVELRWEIVDAS